MIKCFARTKRQDTCQEIDKIRHRDMDRAVGLQVELPKLLHLEIKIKEYRYHHSRK